MVSGSALFCIQRNILNRLWWSRDDIALQFNRDGIELQIAEIDEEVIKSLDIIMMSPGIPLYYPKQEPIIAAPRIANSPDFGINGIWR